ncbi:1-acyl-sn-glycerol-3-phosphate acyltransferase [Azospirillum sp. RWY-5-1]|uniref:1-acyl-sn-glycerol-3-phosphate acyltransferase n=1 Tax=Azospirillum oleiclasticum TaxID=2735135 RepID=A0ABX2T8D1_9PROT|nr:lysophospholipid acyltransferase family protein [Azospirillum oleiclasticum]NYZ12990.1 1-acyl-sn-glycerol-3-phosphate acyltransferase [Azospirillum oleiclasticum]NYZ20337.1 1-acyl-sn-glycerol-3-phosphate acyltransferase [Azospirillum oleiclasticum]
MGSPIIGSLRIALYLAWTLALVPPQLVAMAVGSPLARRIPQLYHRGCARLLGFRLEVHGTMATEAPVLFVCNHSSYLDITVLGALLNASFIAKSEVAGWPLFGFLSKLQRTVFVERRARSDVGRQRDALTARLQEGDNLILFPEGTSSDGNRTLPFKSALFTVAWQSVDGRPVLVQPVSVTATKLDGIPLGINFRPIYAWYGDMDLAPHLWRAFTIGKVTVEVEFHPPVTVEGFPSRKALADHCQTVVAAGVERAITGRRPPVPAPAAPATRTATEPAAA